ncbi:MAG: LysM peptidoglycan-binding domain-containing protein [Alphaproteobacteria bacterium]|nr:LysM peptidoglycan-binding domain-containing protein [Alphaproteobacteria bacterium]
MIPIALLAAALAACGGPEPAAPPTTRAAPPPEPSHRAPRPIPPSGVHRVVRGETLSGIAAAYGLDAAALGRANGILDGDRLEAGERLALRWEEPSTLAVPPRRAAAARAEVRAGRGATAGAPLRVVVTPRPETVQRPDPAHGRHPGEAAHRDGMPGAAPQE